MTTHYIRTVSTSFTNAPRSPSCSSAASSVSHANVLVGLGGLMNKYPPGLGVIGRRTAAPSIQYADAVNSSIHHSPRPAHRLPYTSHRVAPTPIRTTLPYRVPQDPFAEKNSQAFLSKPNRNVVYAAQSQAHTPRLPRIHTSYASTVSRRYDLPPTFVPTQIAAAPDSEARSKLIAGILLNRVNAVGRPMRRRPGDEPRTYVRSGLSRAFSSAEM